MHSLILRRAFVKAGAYLAPAALRGRGCFKVSAGHPALNSLRTSRCGVHSSCLSHSRGSIADGQPSMRTLAPRSSLRCDVFCRFSLPWRCPGCELARARTAVVSSISDTLLSVHQFCSLIVTMAALAIEGGERYQFVSASFAFTGSQREAIHPLEDNLRTPRHVAGPRCTVCEAFAWAKPHCQLPARCAQA